MATWEFCIRIKHETECKLSVIIMEGFFRPSYTLEIVQVSLPRISLWNNEEKNQCIIIFRSIIHVLFATMLMSKYLMIDDQNWQKCKKLSSIELRYNI